MPVYFQFALHVMLPEWLTQGARLVQTVGHHVEPVRALVSTLYMDAPRHGGMSLWRPCPWLCEVAGNSSRWAQFCSEIKKLAQAAAQQASRVFGLSWTCRACCDAG